MTLALFYPALLEGRVFYERDVHAFFYGFAAALRRVVAAGSWPLWNPYVAFGQSFVANPQWELLYPPTWALLVLRPEVYYTAFVAGHVLLSGMGMYALGRRLDLGRAASFVAAAAWIAGGPFVSLANLWHHFAGAAWLPWTLLAEERALRAPSGRTVGLWAAAVGGQLLAGSGDMAVMTALLAAALALTHATRDRRWRPVLSSLAAAYVGGFALASAQWLPTIEMARRSVRTHLPPDLLSAWSAHPWTLVETVWPVGFKDLPLAAAATARLFDGREPFLYSLYLGLAASGLVAAALAGPSHPWRRLLVWSLVLALAFALGRHLPLHAVLVRALPPLAAVRYPVKAMTLVAFAWALLAGLGLRAWEENGRTRKRVTLAAAGALVVTTGAVVYGLRLISGVAAGPLAGWLDVSAPGAPALLGGMATRLATAGALGALLLVLTLARMTRLRLPWSALAAAIVAADLAAANVSVNRTAPPDALSASSPIAEVARPDGHQRLYVVDYSLDHRIREVVERGPHALRPELAGRPWAMTIAYRAYLYPTLLGTLGIESSYDRDQQAFYPLAQARLQDFFLAAEGSPEQVRLLERAGVGRVVSLHDQGFESLALLARVPGPFRGDIRVFGVPHALPRVYAVTGAEVVDGPAALERFASASFDAARSVILPTGAPVAPAESPADATIVEWSADRSRIRAELPRDGWLVTVDAYDPGWRATVDGRPAEVVRANVAFRAVAVPAGRHVVALAFRPPSVLLGLGVSAAAALALAGATLRRR